MKKTIFHYTNTQTRFVWKTLLFSLLLAFSLSKAERSNAQITSITINVNDFLPPPTCSLPAHDSVEISGYLTGSMSTTDTITIHVHFDDGFDTIVRTNVMTTGTSTGWYYKTLWHTIVLPGTYASHAVATAPSGVSASGTSSYSYLITDSCSNVSGYMYLDLNGNCVKDPGEPAISYVPIFVANSLTGDTSAMGYTDYTGHYAFTLMPGSYVVLSNYEGLGGDIAPTCPSTGSASLTVTSGPIVQNFAYQCASPTTMDMSVAMAYTSMTAGHDAWMWLTAGDWFWFSHLTCSSLSATVTLTLDPRVHYVAYDPTYGPAPTSVSGSTITWNITTLTDLYGLWAHIRVHCDPTLTISDTVCNTLHVTPTALTDPNLANNTINACTPVGASYDPNGKSVSPQGTGTQGYIPNNTPLTYNIHFQNTGTAAATNVTLLDTISSNLDMRSLHVLKSSTPVNIHVAGNVVEFRFNNINLPDSTTDPIGSNGSIEYGISPKTSLAPGTQIRNRAGIYFDYNPVVLTNSTLNTIQTTTGVQHLTGNNISASIYPNPANNLLTVREDNQAAFTVALVDLLGRTIATIQSNNGIAQINTASVTNGVYFISITSNDGNNLTSKVMVQH